MKKLSRGVDVGPENELKAQAAAHVSWTLWAQCEEGDWLACSHDSLIQELEMTGEACSLRAFSTVKGKIKQQSCYCGPGFCCVPNRIHWDSKWGHSCHHPTPHGGSLLPPFHATWGRSCHLSTPHGVIHVTIPCHMGSLIPRHQLNPSCFSGFPRCQELASFYPHSPCWHFLKKVTWY